MVTRLSDVSLRQAGFVEIQPGLDGYLGTQRVGFFPVGLDRFEKGNQRIGSVPWWIIPILCQQSREDHLNYIHIIYIYIYNSYPNLNVLWGLASKKAYMRCRYVVSYHVFSWRFSSQKIRGKWTGRSAAILKPAPGVERIGLNGGTWRRTDETWFCWREIFGTIAKWCVYYLLVVFISDVCFGMVWIREESNCGKTPCTKDFGDSLFVLLEDSESTVYNFMFWIRCLIVWRFCRKTSLCE